MKVICTTERVIKEKESCRKEYCCKKLEKAMNPILGVGKRSRDFHSTFGINENKICLATHRNYDEGAHIEDIDFCPFCGKTLVVEHQKIDHTGLPPLLESVPIPPKKKKHWWSK